MPVIRPGPPTWNSSLRRQELVDQLHAELRDEGTEAPRPVIFEMPVNRGKSLHVIVVWDSWKGISHDDRSEMIVEAYERLGEADDGSDYRSKITVALGATPEDAVVGDLLPYSIKPTYPPILPVNPRKKPFPEKQAHGAMLDEGGFRWSNGIYLGFPTLDLAEEVLARLASKLPEAHWHLEKPRR